MATVDIVLSTAGLSVCRWCQKPVSFYNTSSHGRKCTGCLPTEIYCSSCSAENCFEAVCETHSTCWQQHVAGLPPYVKVRHQMPNPFPSLFVEAVMHSESNEQLLQRLHEKDKFARWFSVKTDEESPELWLYDRFIRLCDPGRTGNRDTENHFPTFVSFIGNTSAGKSTIVRAMLLLGLLNSSGEISSKPGTKSLDLVRKVKEGECYMPVPRSGNTEHKTDPTTFGVHLYPDEDPSTELVGRSPSPSSAQASTSQIARFPLLFADCEGFGAGTATTNAMRLTERQEENESAESEKPGIIKLPITAPCYSNGSKTGIDLFYARILYAISDVVVFVTKSDQTIKVDLIRVLEWASTAVRKSYNQPSRKTLIIVRNMERESSESDNSAKTLERLYLRNFGDQRLWEDSPILKSFVQEHNLLVQPELIIEDNERLYSALFHKIRCCYIPDKGLYGVTPERAHEVYSHFKALRDHIKAAADQEQRLRSREFAQYNVPTLSHILGQVFEHFRTSEDPLNFYLAARRDNPTPRDISQHIANFLRLALEPTEGRAPGIEDMIVDAASLMFLIYVQRTFPDQALALNPSDMFEHDLSKFWSNGVEIYISKYEKCIYRFTNKDAGSVYCTVRGKYGHKMHIYSPGPGNNGSPKALEAKGDFVYRRSWSHADKEEWLRNIKRRFKEMYNAAFGTRQEPPLKDLGRVLELRKVVHRKHNSVWNKLQSNKTCLSCLQSVSDHVLPCGHSYCPRCVQEIAQPSHSFECAFDMAACTLCGNHTHNGSHQIQLKPRCTGTRVLTLDGGGIRGIVELALLRALEKEIGLGIQISELFDIIVGTSTGGIIALALAMSGHSTESMIKFFQKAAKDTFGKPRSFNDKVTRVLMVFGRYDSQYSATPLAAELSRFFGPETSLFAPARSRNFQSTTRVAVTTARDEGGTVSIIANYNRPLGDWTRFEREDDAEKDMKIWEAGLATSAAPFYLPPFRKQPENADYIDGAVYANCPAKVAIEEVGKLFPNEGTSVDILLSLGTGHQTKKKPKIPKAIRYGVFIPLLHMFERQMNTGEIWDDLLAHSTAHVKARLHRLNPEIQGHLGDYVDINHHEELKYLLDSVGDWAKAGGDAYISKICRILIANLFFFEPDPENLPKEGNAISGSIRCRLKHESEAVQTLLEKRVAGFWHTTVTKGEAHEVHKLTNSRWRPVRDVSGAKSRPSQMTVEEGERRKFRLNFQQSVQQGCFSYQVLAVQLVGEQDKIPISGFPATMEELNQRCKAHWLQ